MPVLVRGATAFLLLVAGVAAGIAATALHQRWWGLALGVVVGVLVTALLPRGWSWRLPFVGGWAVAVGLATAPRPEGDYLVPANGQGYALLVLSLVMAVVALVTLPARRAREAGRAAADDRGLRATAT